MLCGRDTVVSEFLSRGIDYLGDLGAKLRDLQGHRSLAHELMQNADDAPTATSMTFDVRPEALIVDNDGTFRDCKSVESPVCPWKTGGSRGYRCDFHRFRSIAAGDKRSEQGTTGAFGIGFIAVYQITDAPELISSGRHWILDELKPESQRIQVCASCPRCSRPDLPGTRFILPWARDASSELRKVLRAESVTDTTAEEVLQELEQSLPIAMLFLKRLRSIGIKRDGHTLQTVQRVDEGDDVLISVGETNRDSRWHIIRGDFKTVADELRARHGSRIEEKRLANVAVAVPAGEFETGLLCAGLPTEHDIGLPFHVNADFFPTNDRKRVILGSDFQSEWNREALRAAAQTVGEHVEQLPVLLGARRFWKLASQLKDLAEPAGASPSEPSLSEFWHQLEPRLQTLSAVLTSTNAWAQPSQAMLLLQPIEVAAIAILEALEVPVVHEDLRPYQNILRSSAVGVQLLGVQHIADALEELGLDQRVGRDELPAVLTNRTGLESLWKEILVLLERQQRNAKVLADDEERVRGLALAPGRDGGLWPLGEVYRADDETVELFESTTSDVAFLAIDDGFGRLAELCLPFDAGAAVDALEASDVTRLSDAWKEHRLRLPEIFAWFENHRAELLGDTELTRRLSLLSIFPSSRGLHSLSELSLPGDFEDQLGLADLVDLDAFNGRREFLRDLGMTELDFRTYAVERVPGAFEDDAIGPETRRAAVALLASRLGELRDDDDALAILSEIELVECGDGVFRQAGECYFDSPSVRECLGRAAFVAKAPPQEHVASVRDLYSALGVLSLPRFGAVVAVLKRLTSQPYSARTAERVRTILAHLAPRIATDRDLPHELNPLTELPWLPARGKTDRWYKADELFATYQSFLFETQAHFVDGPIALQNACRDLFQHIGVQITPPPTLVVKHLLQSVADGTSVNKEVYSFLDRNHADRSLALLTGKKCLWINEGYRSPGEVFWSEHPFGRYRWRLAEELRSYGDFLKRLEVKDAPDFRDSLEVIKEISGAYGARNAPVDDDARAVLSTCWEFLERALNDTSVSPEEIQNELGDKKCVLNAAGILYAPDHIFFDNRAGLAAKFGTFLRQNVIARPLGAASALSAAGVRQLGSAVDVEVLEVRDATDAPDMEQLFLERRNELGRVLAAQGVGTDVTGALARLLDIRCSVVSLLKVQYRLEAFGRPQTSNPEFVPASFEPDGRTLYFTKQDGVPNWSAVARELAIAMFPDEDPGRFSSGLKEVLASKTLEAASSTLDELGFAHVDTVGAAAPTGGNVAEGLGTDEATDVEMDGGPSATDGGSQAEDASPEDDLTAEEALRQLLGGDAPDPTSPTPDPLGPEATGLGTGRGDGTGVGAGRSPNGAGLGAHAGSSGRDGAGRGSSDQREGAAKRTPGSPGGRPFISYVAAHPDDEEPDPDHLDQEARMALEDKAIQFILAREPELERTPMNNPGFDLTEPGADGAPVRWVEVKAMTGSLHDRPVGLTHTQFDFAQEHRAAYWLYVVENADGDARLVRIKDPAGQARTFTFDHGWLAVAEVGGEQDDREERMHVED
jgi:hypothetical protein